MKQILQFLCLTGFASFLHATTGATLLNAYRGADSSIIQSAMVQVVKGNLTNYVSNPRLISIIPQSSSAYIDQFEEYSRHGGNTNGQWFQTPYSDGTIMNINIREVTEDGSPVLALEQRAQSSPTDNVIAIVQTKISKQTRLIKKMTKVAIRGKNPMLDQSIEELIKHNPIECEYNNYIYEFQKP